MGVTVTKFVNAGKPLKTLAFIGLSFQNGFIDTVLILKSRLKRELLTLSVFHKSLPSFCGGRLL